MSDIIAKPEHLGGENFPAIFQAMHPGADLEVIRAGVDARRENYLDLFGTAPGDEYICWSLILNRVVDQDELYRDYDPTKNPEPPAIDPATQFFFDSEEWHIQDKLCPVDRFAKEKDLSPLFENYDFLLTLFAGVELVGWEGSGDGLLIGLQGHGASHPVYSFGHDYGTVEDMISGSIGAFLVEAFGVGSEDDEQYMEDEAASWFPLGQSREHRAAIRNYVKAFNDEREQAAGEGPFQHDPIRLFKRAHWLLQHTTGKPTYDFASLMKFAPDFQAWEKERDIIAGEPHLANYWLLHHFFLGNHHALREAMEAVRESPARITRFLAESIGAAAEEKGDGRLFTLNGDAVRKLISDTRRNADIKILEGAEREKILSARGEDKIKRISPDVLEALREDSAGLWRALEEYPEDIQGHDEVLRGLARLDESLEETIDDYFDERTSEPYNEWPADWQLEDDYNPDPRLSLPIAAAFISGLKFNDENEQAFSGLTNTLAVFDDDHSMHAYERAIEMLGPEDDRGEYVFRNLNRSKHSRAREVTLRGARRFFDIMEEAIRRENELTAERERDGVTLNNMWDTANWFHIPLRACLEWMDDDAEEIARRVLERWEHMGAFKLNFGRAWRVMGERGIGDFNDKMVRFIEWVGEQKVEKESTVGPLTILNLSEACIALAKLNPEKARSLIPELFARETPGRFFDLDIRAALLGGMFILDEYKENSAAWLERLLGNRDNHGRLTGALRAAEVSGRPESFEWVRYHLYSDTNTFMGHHKLIKDMAFAAAEALGHRDLPRFDDEDEYANKVPVQELPQAMSRPQLYDIEHVLQRIHEKKHKSPDVIGPVRDYLMDICRYSGDDDGRTFDGQWPGFKAMAIQGPAAQSAIMEILDLEHCRMGIRNDAIYLMRLLESETEFILRLHEKPLEELLDWMRQPTAESLGYLELIAGRAYLLDPAAAREAMETCLRFRFRWCAGNYAEEDPALIRLPLLYAMYGKSSQELLKELRDAAALNDEYGAHAVHESLAGAIRAAGRSSKFTLRDEFEKSLKMKRFLRGEDWMNGRGTMEVTAKDLRLTIKCTAHDFTFNGVFSEMDHTTSATWTGPNAESVARRLGEIANLALLLGYKLEKAKPVKKKSKAGKK